ncbi:RNA polymerase II-associated protein spaghetti isoform X2 [Halictus rubicundus]|uniref:RNA polymerase II-associated protein spaghetti isoform X2 n=1 Tax=Halictus rubicundus TaxID=77578 RepID=UPI004036CB31
MDKSLLMQKQVKDNAEDMQKEFLDMKNWEAQMKRKDEELRREASGQPMLPPVRSKSKNKIKSAPTKENENNNKSKRIKSYDYSAWDKFDVDKACKDVEKEEQSDSSGDETMSTKQLEKAHEEATKHKEEGNRFVQQQKWVNAIQCYNQAITIFAYDAVFFANRGLCQLKLNNFHSAESDCSAAIQLDETYVKAYHRRATARMNLKQYKEAKQDLEKILKLEPSNKEAKSLLLQIEKKINVSNENTNKSSKNSIDKKIGEKLCSNTVPSTNSTLTKDTKDIKHSKEDKKDIKNDKDLGQTICNEKGNKPKETLKSVEDRKPADAGSTTLKQKEIGLRIPDWLPEKNDVVIIEPITRPPHLRSKKSLKKIPVVEVDFDSVRQDYKNDEITGSAHKLVQLESNSTNDNLKTNNSVEAAEPSASNDEIPPVPKTAVQFIMNWKKNKSFEFRYMYLKQIPKNSLSKIFQDSMESDIFSDILEVLRIEYIKREEFIFSYLEDLSDVKRFRTLIMFMSNKDKENLKILFEHCKIVDNVLLDEVLTLQGKYEI